MVLNAAHPHAALGDLIEMMPPYLGRVVEAYYDRWLAAVLDDGRATTMPTHWS